MTAKTTMADLLGKLDSAQRLSASAMEQSLYADSAQAREQDERRAAQYAAEATKLRKEIDTLRSSANRIDGAWPASLEDSDNG
jgi:hypothetical protein